MASDDGIDFTPTNSTATADPEINFTPLKAQTPPQAGDGIDFQPIKPISTAPITQAPPNPAQAQDQAASTPLDPNAGPLNDPTQNAAQTPQGQAYLQGAMKGLAGINPSDPQLAQDHPIISHIGEGVGQLAGLATIGSGVSALVGPAAKAAVVANGMSLLPAIEGAAQVGTGAATFGIKEALDKLSKSLQGTPDTMQDVADVGKATLGGALYGGANTIAAPVARLTAQGLVGVGVAKLQGASNIDAAVNGVVNTMFGLSNMGNLDLQYKLQAVQTLHQNFATKLNELGVPMDNAVDIANKYTYGSAMDLTGIKDPQKAMETVLKDPNSNLDYFEKLDNNIKNFKQPVSPGLPGNQPVSTATPETPAQAAPETAPPEQTPAQVQSVMPKLPETVPGPNGPIATSSAVPPVIPNTQPLSQGQPNENTFPVQGQPNAGGSQVVPNASNTQPLDANTVQYVNEASQAAARPEVQATQTTVPNVGKLGSLIDQVHADGGHILDTQTNPQTGEINVTYQNPTAPDLSNESGQAQLPIEGITNMAKEVVATLNPRGLVPREALDSIMKMKGQQDKTEFELEAKLSNVEKAFDKMSQADSVAFIDNIKTGNPQATPALQAIADMMRKVEDQYWAEAKQFKPSLAYKDDHYRVLWKVIPGSAQAQAKGGFKGLYRKPLQGTRGFAKESTLADMSEGLAKGGVPYSYNPMTMWRNSIMDMQKFITANRMWAEMKKMGYVKFVKAGGQFPSDYVRLNDAIAKKYFPTDEGMVQAGEYFVEPNTARILNNYLGTDWLRNSAVGGSLLKLKNMSTALELSLSPFHASYVSIAAMANSMSVGLQKVLNQGIYGNPKAFLSGLSNIVLSPTAPINYAKAGTDMIKMVSDENFLNSRPGQDFIKAFPQAKQLLEDLFTGGGKLAIHQDYKINSLQAFKEGIKNKEPWAVTISALPAANEMIMKPLFEVYIPRLKIGAFLHEYSNEIVQRSADLQSGKITRAQLARQTWTSIENRFGEMNFDNLFWDRTFKTAMQMAFRSVTWKVGALSNIVGFGPEQIAQWKRDLEEGRGPTIHRNFSYLFGIGILLTLFSSLIMKTYLKQWPSSLKDLVAPRYDKDGNRIMLNTHAKDWIHIAHSPGKFLQSSMSGIIGRFFDVVKNKDFWDTDIANPDDPEWKKLIEQGSYLVGQPFSFSNYKRLSDLATPGALKGLNIAGITQPAPAYVSDSSALQMAKEIRASHFEVGGRTQEQSNKSLVSYKLAQQYDKDKDKSVLENAVYQGEITKEKMDSIIKDYGLDNMQKIITHGGGRGEHMDFDDMAKIMKDGKPTDEEAKEILPIMAKTLKNNKQPVQVKKDMQKTLNGFESKYGLPKTIINAGWEEEPSEPEE